jgi:transcription initiation factor IIF auxiliary subunit
MPNENIDEVNKKIQAMSDKKTKDLSAFADQSSTYFESITKNPKFLEIQSKVQSAPGAGEQILSNEDLNFLKSLVMQFNTASKQMYNKISSSADVSDFSK